MIDSLKSLVCVGRKEGLLVANDSMLLPHVEGRLLLPTSSVSVLVPNQADLDDQPSNQQPGRRNPTEFELLPASLVLS